MDIRIDEDGIDDVLKEELKRNPEYCTLDFDEVLNQSLDSHPEMCSISDFVRGHKKLNNNKKFKTKDLKPIVFVALGTRHTKKGKQKPVLLKALLDSGGSGTLLCEKYATKLRRVEEKNGKTVWTTPAGELETKTKVKCSFSIPEMHQGRVIDCQIHLTESLGNYDMIIGRDLLTALGMDIRFSDNLIYWDEAELPFRDTDSGLESFHIPEPNLVREVPMDNDYEQADLDEVAESQTQLTEDQQDLLKTTLQSHESLFDGTLGKWNMEPYEFELKPGAQPYHARAFPVPHRYMETLKKEVYRLCKVGVLKKVNRSEWAAPTFIIPKKDGKVRFITDLRELNKRIKRKPYPIPKVQDMMLQLKGFQWATALDLNMGYYHVELAPASKKLCTIVLPFGKFEYQRLPQGCSVGPDIFQEKMSELFDGFEYVRAYIDDILVLTKGSFEDHMDKLSIVLQRLKDAGLKVNVKKSFFARTELEYLGYWITRDGIQPQTKKVEAVKKILPPTNKKELRRFIGIVNYYRDMWVRRSHILAPLAALTSKGAKWKWTEVKQKAFNDMKRVIARDVMLAYPDFSKKL